MLRPDLSLLRLLRHPGCTLAHLRVIAEITRRARHDPDDPDFGWSWPSLEQLAGDTGLSRRSLLRSLQFIESNGFLYVHRAWKRGEGKGREVNRYWVLSGPPVMGASNGTLIAPRAPDKGAKNPPDKGATLQGESGPVSIQGTIQGKEPPYIPPPPESLAAGQDAGASSGGNGHSSVNVVGEEPDRRKALVVQGQAAFARLAALSEQEAEVKRIREEMVSLAFAYWAIRTNHLNALQDPKRERILRNRLVENSNNINELLFVVDGLKRDKSLMGDNDRGRKYDGIETIYRDRAIVERLAELGGYSPGTTHPQVAELMRRAEQQGH